MQGRVHIWDSGNIIADIGTETVYYIRVLTLIYAKKGETKTYYRFNGHGDVIALANSSGAIIKRYKYDSFGVEENPGIFDTNVFRYCGEYYDAETKTIYLRARYYDAETGRFTQQDGWSYAVPGFLLSLNLYTYCGNDPVNHIDPSGHAWWHWALAATLVAACAVATIATCGGFAAAATAVSLAIGGSAAGTASACVATGALIGSTAALGMAAFTTAINSESIDDFAEQGNWGTVGFVATGGLIGGYCGYQQYKSNDIKLKQDKKFSSEDIRDDQVHYNLNGSKDIKYVNDRGWNDDLINDAINNGNMGTAINKANGQSCTVYCYPGTRFYVVFEDSTGSLVQASQFGDVNWIPDSTITWNN